jgi:hypothetical protein
MSLPPLK